MKKDLYLFDSYAQAFRSYYAFIRNPLINSQGEHTEMIFGYLNALFRLILERKTSFLAIATDLPGTTFRHDLYPEYKANRSEMPEEMRMQIPMLQEFQKICGIPVMSCENCEADDVMASLARQAQRDGFNTYMVTRDKDMMQLVGDGIYMLQLEKGGKPPIVTDVAQVEEKFKVRPDQVRDLLALMGDSSDNVPGVPKVGPKTAADLLVQFGSLDGIYENLDKITRKALHKNLGENQDKARLSQELVSLKEDLDLGVDIADLNLNNMDFGAIKEFCKRYELGSVLRQVDQLERMLGENSVSAEDIKQEKPDYVLVDSAEVWQELKAGVEAAEVVALDLETTSLNTQKADIVGVCIAYNAAKGYYIPVGHLEGENQDLATVQSWLEQDWQNSPREWVFHNAKYDLQVLAERGWTLPTQIQDSMVASFVLNAAERAHSLDEQVYRRFAHEMTSIESLIGKGKNQKNFSELTIAESYAYGAEDAVFTWKLWKTLKAELINKSLWDHYLYQELPLVSVLRQMESRGVELDRVALQGFSKELQEEILVQEKEIFELAGEEFNIASPKQLGVILFEKLGLPHGKKNKSGGFSTSAQVLDSLRWDYEIVDRVLKYREVVKLKNTYVDVLPELVSEKTARIHTSFNQTVAATGRLSSNNPNLQNIPIRTEYGRRIRGAFKTSQSDKVYFAADYSQIELRVLAHLSKDPALMEAYQANEDIHTRTASMLFQTFPEMITTEQRRQAKAINFGVIYGMSAFRLSKELGIPRQVAQEFIDDYFDHFSGVTDFVDSTIAQAREDGFVRTEFGHIRQIPELFDDNRNMQSMGERQAVNSIIQGTAADIIKKAMIEVEKKLAASDIDAQMLLQVHDELVFEAKETDLELLQTIVVSAMENAVELKVPLKVEFGSGKSWLDAH